MSSILSELDYDANIKEFDRDKELVKDVRFLCLIIRGSVGRIYTAVNVGTAGTIAVKIVDYFHENYKDRTVQEDSIHSLLKHKNIIELYIYYTHDSSLIMHMDLTSGVDLTELVSKQKPCQEERSK